MGQQLAVRATRGAVGRARPAPEPRAGLSASDAKEMTARGPERLGQKGPAASDSRFSPSIVKHSRKRITLARAAAFKREQETTNKKHYATGAGPWIELWSARGHSVCRRHAYKANREDDGSGNGPNPTEELRAISSHDLTSVETSSITKTHDCQFK